MKGDLDFNVRKQWTAAEVSLRTTEIPWLWLKPVNLFVQKSICCII